MPAPRINLEYAHRFLTLLGKYTDDQFTFQTFDDNHMTKRSALARMLHGNFNQHARSLTSLNADGAGVYVTVNRTDLRGRTNNNIARIRAYFVDKDNGAFDRNDLIAPPHLIVRTKNGEHAYWLVKEEGDMAATPEYLADFPYVQKALIHRLGGDMSAHDLARVMRIPGFHHLKGVPFMVSIITAREGQKPYTRDELVDLMDLDVDAQRPKKINTRPVDQSAFPSHADRVKRCQKYMEKVEGAIEGNNGDRHTYNTCKIGGDFGLTDDEFWPILLDWNRRCKPPWDDWELRKKLERASERRTDPFGHRLFEEREQPQQRHQGLRRVVRVNGPGPDAPNFWPEEEAGWLDKAHPPQPRQAPEVPEFDEPPEDFYESEAQRFQEEDRPAARGGDGDGDGDGDGTPGGGKRKPLKITGKPWSRKGNPDGPWASRSGRAPAEQRSVPEMVRIMKQNFDLMRAPNDALYVYTGKHWRGIRPDTLRAMCLTADYEAHTTPQRRTNVRKTIEDECSMSKDVPWNDLKPEEIPFDNGVYNILTRRMRHHRPKDYLDKFVPIEFDPEATCPRWMQCLEDWFPGEEEQEKKAALQEFFGYILMTSTAKYKKCLVLLGESDSGKSQVLGVAREMVGIENICQIPLEQMDDSRKRAPIKGKLLNVISELPQWGTLAESGFKMLVSTDEPVEIDVKHVQQETIIPTAKHIVATNSFPQINDRSKGVINRMLVIKLLHVIEEERQDVHLLERLKQELPGIANWAIEGARRLIESGGQWTKPSGMSKLLKHYAATSNPIQLFIEDDGRIIQDPEGKIRTGKFAEMYRESPVYQRMSYQRLLRTMEDLGYPTRKLSGYKYYIGLRERTTADGLVDPPEPPEG